MSGHSKWANIKHKKEKTDAQKGKVFTKLGREIIIAVRQGGPDPESNYKLKEVILKAKSCNMPNENIQRSIKKGSGDLNSENYEEISYEGYGPGGVAIIIETLTDNRNRTAGDIRHLLDKYNGNLGTTGCVSFMFKKKGILLIEKSSHIHEDILINKSIELGVEDFNIEDEYYEIITSPENFSTIKNGLSDYEFASASIEMIPDTTVKVEDPQQIDRMETLIEKLDDLDDVKNIFHNME